MTGMGARVKYPFSAVTGLMVLTAVLVLVAQALADMAAGSCTMAFVFVVWLGVPLVLLWAGITAIEVFVRKRKGDRGADNEEEEARDGQ